MPCHNPGISYLGTTWSNGDRERGSIIYALGRPQVMAICFAASAAVAFGRVKKRLDPQPCQSFSGRR